MDESSYGIKNKGIFGTIWYLKQNLLSKPKQMRSLFNKLLPLLSRFVAAFLCIGVTKLVVQPFEPLLEIQIIALLYLLPVMISTVLWGLLPGVLASFTAFLVFNYFYIQPYKTLRVHQTQDLITLIIFLGVSVVVSQLIGRAREGMRLARSREWEATHMYELISALSGLQNIQSISSELANHTLKTFRFDRVEVLFTAENGQEAIVTSTAEHIDQTDPRTTTYPLETARGLEGRMRIGQSRSKLSSEETRLLEAYTSQGALSLERVRLSKGENKARILEESDRLKSSLLNSVSHELRTPLAAIKASVSSLRSGTVDWNIPARQDLLAMMEEETDHLNLLVGNLLDMSRIESGALKPLKRWNSIAEVAIGVATKMRNHLENHHIEMDFSEDMPLVPMDYVMIGQIFTNLISNSIKYAPTDTTISIKAFKEHDYAHIEIANQGPPVPEEHLERIFDKFYRVTEADRITGTGLGLSICKGIVEAHGGKIWAENRASQFAFHFILPLRLDGALPDIPKEELDE